MAEHTLRTWPEPYAALEIGLKTWEFREDDRGFQVGDVLLLEYWDPAPVEFGHRAKGVEYFDGPITRKLRREVTYILHGGRFGIPVGFCIMSIRPVDGS